MDFCIYPPDEIIEATIKLPQSKSFINRLLIIKALTGETILTNPEWSDDIQNLANGLNASSGNRINVGGAGTAMRFLIAFFATRQGTEVTLDGSTRMRQRPVKILVDALRELGAEIAYENEEGFPPVKISGRKLQGGTLTIKPDVSSQYISALMLVAPYMEKGLTMRLDGEPVSAAYIRMTAAMMRSCGIDVEIAGNEITIEPGKYHLPEKQEDLDWSAASYWAEIVALSAGFVTLTDLDIESPQGDREMLAIFEKLGVDSTEAEEGTGVELMAHPELHSRLDIDMTDNPDLVQTVAVTCALLNIPFNISGLSTLRIKETDRLEALKAELLKFGCMVEIENNDRLTWDGRRFPITERPVIETYDDHRMALAFAPAALYIPGIVIKNAEVVSKSYPGYWDDLRLAGFTVEEFKEESASDE